MTLRFLRVDKTNDDDEDGLKFGASGLTIFELKYAIVQELQQ